jgi:cytochrome c556
MHKLTAPLVLLLALQTAPVLCDEDEMDTDLMQTIDDTTKSVTSNIDLRKKQAADEDAHALQKLLSQVEVFYETRHDKADAVEFARTSLEIANRLQKLLTDKDFEGAARAANELSRSCRSCHDVYKHS